MELLTTRVAILGIIEDLKESLDIGNVNFFLNRNCDKNYLENLKKLDLQITTIEEVNEAIGCPYLQYKFCLECGKKVDIVIQLGERPDYESSTTWVCEECLEKALKLIKEEGEK